MEQNNTGAAATASRIEKVRYTARTHVTGGREGAGRSDDGRLDIKFTLPGAPGNGTNPEQLFAAGWSACYMGAMSFAASKKGVQLPADAAVDAEVDLGTGAGGYMLQARLRVSLPGLDRGVAQEIIEEAHLTCPYSKAVHGNIPVETTLA